MYSTCIFCHADLGQNESVEHFPIGRRLAFDAAHGRLWVVCRKCERWNLTPLEERWEAIEECERLFSETKLRVSTDQIGLARLREGLELVRIGEPQRPEMAAWRYGDQFGRRRKRHLLYGSALLAGGLGAAAIDMFVGGAATTVAGLIVSATTMTSLTRQKRIRARFLIPHRGVIIGLRGDQIRRAMLTPQSTGWGLRVAYTEEHRRTVVGRNGKPFTLVGVPRESTLLLVGEEARRLTAQLLPTINEEGARRGDIESAVDIVEEAAGDRDAMLRRWVEPPANPNAGVQIDVRPSRSLASLPAPVRLALEMMTHEESERRALQGELSILEDAWRDAEEIAAIADALLISDGTRDKLASLDDSARDR